MGFKAVEFHPSQARLSTTFLKNCGRSESLGTATCLITVVGGKQGDAVVVGKHGHAPCKIHFI